jgi:hypothetical protein
MLDVAGKAGQYKRSRRATCQVLPSDPSSTALSKDASDFRSFFHISGRRAHLPEQQSGGQVRCGQASTRRVPQTQRGARLLERGTVCAHCTYKSLEERNECIRFRPKVKAERRKALSTP